MVQNAHYMLKDYFFFLASRTAFRACLVARRFVVFFDLDVLSRALIRLGIMALYSKILFFGILCYESNFIQFFSRQHTQNESTLNIRVYQSIFSRYTCAFSCLWNGGGSHRRPTIFILLKRQKF